jgi:UDP-3-O-[3-hydroxymyristoyl] glucosamine N-acyltransferase
MKYTISKIAEYLKGEVVGNASVEINNLARIEEAKQGDITFLANPIYTPHVYTTKASAVVVKSDFVPEKEINTNLIKVADPYQAFSQLLSFYNGTHLDKNGVEKDAFIAETAQIGKDCYIGAFAYIGENVKIGNNVKIFPNSFVGQNSKIDDNTIIFPNVTIYHDTIIGKSVTIHSGTVIGADGFGFAPNNGKDFKKVPQIGNVIIEDYVEIGANAAIDRATMGSTILRRGVKLDNFLQVAHNVEIDENTVIAAHTGISGSTKVGKNCMIGGQVGMAGHIKIGNNVKVGAQSGISHSLKDNEIVVGTPALPIRNFKKSSILFKNLEELHNRIKELEEKIKDLK